MRASFARDGCEFSDSKGRQSPAEAADKADLSSVGARLVVARALAGEDRVDASIDAIDDGEDH